MTPQERQIKLTELQEGFTKTVLQLKAKPGEAVPFVFAYSGKLPIQCYTLGCGCTSAEYREDDLGAAIYGTVDVDSLDHIQRFYVKDNTDMKTWVKNAAITVFFDDGQDFFTLKGKERVLNPDKISVPLNVKINVEL